MPVDVLAKPHLFRQEVYRAEALEGQTITEILGGDHGHLHVCLNDTPIPRAYWRHIRPKAGAQLIISAIPQGGGGGKDVLRVVAMIAVVVVASYLGGPLAGALGFSKTGLAAVGIKVGLTLAGSLAVNALIPPQLPSTGGGGSADRFNRLTGSRNQYSPYSVIPRLFGRLRYFPPLAAIPYTEMAGDDQYLRMLLCLGYGPLLIGGMTVGFGGRITQSSGISIGSVRIGDTPIEKYADVQWEIGTISEMTIYTRDVSEEPISVVLPLQNLTGEGAWFSDDVSEIRTSAIDADELSVDITFAQGLWTSGKDGDINNNDIVEFRIDYSVAGSASWITAHLVHVNGPVKRPFTRSWRWGVARNQYDVRVTRVRSYIGDNETKFMDATWTALRTFTNKSPWTRSDTILMGLRIRATEQLNGIVDELSVLAQSVLPIWNGSIWHYQGSSNPAWIYVEALKGAQVQNPVPDERLDLAAIKDWADWCMSNAVEYNWIHDTEETVIERIRSIASTGRASWAIQDSLFTVVRDTATTTPVQMISPRNSWGFSSDKAFFHIPHAVKVRWLDPTTGQQAERIVYDDDYSAGNATQFEVLETQGVTNKNQAWKEGRFHLAQLRLRPEIYTVSMDAENLVATRGDLVRLAHDVMLVGITWGRVKAIAGNNLTLDEQISMETGKTYGVRARLSDGTTFSQSVVTMEGTFNTFTLDEAIADLEIGDLILFGETGLESIEAKILNIDYHADLSATLKLIDAAPAIQTADTGTIPDYDPNITIPPDPTTIKPASPVVLSVVSDESVIVIGADGTLRSRIVIGFKLPSTVGVTAEVEARYRINDSDSSWSSAVPALAGDGSVVIDNVIDEQTYAIEIRTRSPWDTYSGWIPIIHTVIGKTAPPPPVDQFTVTRLADGTRRFSWTLISPPPDVRVGGGYRIKYQIGASIDWDNATPLHSSLLRDSPHESNQLAAGTYTFGIVAVDSSENESLTPLTITATLGDPRLRNVLIQHLDHELQWSGTISFGFLDTDNVLREASTWDQLPNTWDELADSWNTLEGVNGIVYETIVMDVGADADFTPLVTATGIGSRVLEMKTGSEADGDVTGAYGPISAVQGKRYIQIRVTVSGTNPTLSSLTTLLDAEVVIDEFEDINTLTASGAWFERLSAGHFRIASRKPMASISMGAIRAIQNLTAPHTWTLVSKSAVVTGNSSPAAEFKIFDNGGTLVDALVDIELKGPKVTN